VKHVLALHHENSIFTLRLQAAALMYTERKVDHDDIMDFKLVILFFISYS